MLFKANEEDRDAVLAILKIGEVTDIDPAKCKIRATFDDEDGKTSFWLPVLQRKTLHDKDFWLPDVGEDVLCLFFNEAEEPALQWEVFMPAMWMFPDNPLTSGQ